MSDAREVLAACWLDADTDADGDLEWAHGIVRDFREAEHYGDCTQVPMTCTRCIVDEAFAKTDVQLAALAAAGLAVMPDWQPIETAPKDIPVLLYWPLLHCPSYGDYGTEPHIAIGWWKTNDRLALTYSDGTRKRDADEIEKLGLMASYFSDTNEMDDYGMGHPDYQPTHWMPLPVAPKP